MSQRMNTPGRPGSSDNGDHAARVDFAPLIGQRWGRYTFTDLIGRGNRSAVYQARNMAENRLVAIRVLDHDLGTAPDFLARFHATVAAAAILQHPHILPILDHGEHDGLAYLVRPYIGGSTLRNHLGKPLPPIEALQFLRPIAAALDFAHAHGIVHGDLKPGNILLPAATHPLLADLGTAGVVQLGNNVVATAKGEHFGTPEYLSPEQGRGTAFDGRADLYALGVILYEALTGRPPFRAERPEDTARTVVMAHIATPPPDPRVINPDLSPAVEPILRRALAKRPDDRYSSATALIDALDHALQEEGTRPDLVAEPATSPGTNPRRRTVGRRPLLVAALVALLLVGAGLGTGLARRSVSDRSGPSIAFVEPTPMPAPPASRTWFFADSWTGEGYTTVLRVQNPGATPVEATLAFVNENGQLSERSVTIPANGAQEFDLARLFNNDPNNRAIAQRVTADAPVLVTHRIDKQGRGQTIYGATGEGTRWQFSEGRPTSEFNKWLELANFGPTEATVRVRYETPEGKSATRTYGVPARTLRLVDLNRDFPNGLGRWTIEANNGVSIVAEMSAYTRDDFIVANMVGELLR